MRRYFPKRVAEKLAGRFRDADLYQLGLLNKELQQKADISSLHETNAQQMRMIAQAGGPQSSSVRSKQLMSDYLATSGDIARREIELNRTSKQRTQNEIQIQQFHLAVEKDQTKDNPIARLYGMIPSLDVIISQHESTIQHNETLNDFKSVMDDQDAELGNGGGESLVNADAMLALNQFISDYETDELKMMDAVLLDSKVDQSDNAPSMVSKVKQSSQFTRLIAMESNIDTS